MKHFSYKNTSKKIKPYFLLAIAATIAYAPLSLMMFTIKNDVLMIEYPIQHFISESLRNGNYPLWFNTWGMGFPLQSVLSWGVFSTPQMLTGLFFESSIWVLHSEFLFFIIASGWAMYKLLKEHILSDKNLALLFAACYMLSGFTVASSQWLLYITGMSFIPFVIYTIISLIKKPGIKYTLLFSFSYFLLFTNVHIYLTVVFTYCLLFFFIARFFYILVSPKHGLTQLISANKYFFLSFLLIVILCFAPAYYTMEVVNNLERANSITNKPSFFQSNYLHPRALSSLLYPLSAIKPGYTNTDGVVLNTYLGLFPLLIFFPSLLFIKKKGNKVSVLLTIVTLFFLVVSFGHLTPLRGYMNILPGFSNFRHPGVLRLFFTISIIISIAYNLKQQTFEEILFISKQSRKLLLSLTGFLLLMSLFISLYLYPDTSFTKVTGLSDLKKIAGNINHSQLLFINSFILLVFSTTILFLLLKKRKFIVYFFLADVIVATLICTPFYTISSYPIKEVENIFNPTKGFPIQKEPPSMVPPVLTDNNGNSWHNINTYQKKITSRISMPGPLIINNVERYLSDSILVKKIEGKQLLFIKNPASYEDTCTIKNQEPSNVSADIFLSKKSDVVLLQANFPGWTIYVNGKKTEFTKKAKPFLGAEIEKGNSTVTFIYRKPFVVVSSLLLHLICLLVIGVFFFKKLYQIFFPRIASDTAKSITFSA